MDELTKRLMKKHRKWTAFVVYAPPRRQIEIVKKLIHIIRLFDHYNFNTYEDHISIRVCGKVEKILVEHLDGLGTWKKQPYDYEGRRSYELGTRAAFIYLMDKGYYDRDHKGKGISLVEVVHGFLDNIGVGEKREARLHRRMWWHFAVRKPYHRMKRRLKNRLLFWKRK